METTPPEWPAREVRVDQPGYSPMRGLLTARLSFRLEAAEDLGTAFRLQFTVAERDSGKPILLTFLVRISLEDDTTDRVRLFKQALRTALTHEIDEAIMLDGVRVIDVHSLEPETL